MLRSVKKILSTGFSVNKFSYAVALKNAAYQIKVLPSQSIESVAPEIHEVEKGSAGHIAIELTLEEQRGFTQKSGRQLGSGKLGFNPCTKSQRTIQKDSLIIGTGAWLKGADYTTKAQCPTQEDMSTEKFDLILNFGEIGVEGGRKMADIFLDLNDKGKLNIYQLSGENYYNCVGFVVAMFNGMTAPNFELSVPPATAPQQAIVKMAESVQPPLAKELMLSVYSNLAENPPFFLHSDDVPVTSDKKNVKTVIRSVVSPQLLAVTSSARLK